MSAAAAANGVVRPMPRVESPGAPPVATTPGASGGTAPGGGASVGGASERPKVTALETTQGQIDGFFSQLPCKCHQNRMASVGD